MYIIISTNVIVILINYFPFDKINIVNRLQYCIIKITNDIFSV